MNATIESVTAADRSIGGYRISAVHICAHCEAALAVVEPSRSNLAGLLCVNSGCITVENRQLRDFVRGIAEYDAHHAAGGDARQILRDIERQANVLHARYVAAGEPPQEVPHGFGSEPGERHLRDTMGLEPVSEGGIDSLSLMPVKLTRAEAVDRLSDRLAQQADKVVVAKMIRDGHRGCKSLSDQELMTEWWRQSGQQLLVQRSRTPEQEFTAVVEEIYHEAERIATSSLGVPPVDESAADFRVAIITWLLAQSDSGPEANRKAGTVHARLGNTFR